VEVPKLIGRRDLLAASSMSLVAPVLGTAAQAAVPERKVAPVFNLWVISDPHVGTDKAMSTAVQHGMVGFNPSPVHPESLAEALRQSENGSAIGAPPIPWDLALNLGDYAGFWDAPEDEQGREVIRQYSVLKQHRREQIYNIAGNHDASPHGAPSSEGKEANWWFRKWADPLGEHPETSLVDNAKRPYPIDGTWERYTFKFGNVRVLMMSDRNDLPYPIGRMATGGASPAGAVTAETFEWWKGQVERARANGEIIISCHHHMLRETTVGSGDFEGVEKNPDGTYRRGKVSWRRRGPGGSVLSLFRRRQTEGAGLRALYGRASGRGRSLARWSHPYVSGRRAQWPFACRTQMGRQLRQLRAIVEVSFHGDLPADEPPLHLHGGLQTRTRAVLPSR
jgi:Calcineurin-like phosphoesterase